MYSAGSLECLKNARKLLNDSLLLIRRRSFGTAQSLGVTALEEIGKAIILELANLNYVEKDVVEKAMKDHIPKKVIVQAIEKGFVLRDNIARKAETATVTKDEVNRLKKMLKDDVDSLENKRQKGFYVQVNIHDGKIDSPLVIGETEVKEFIKEVISSFDIALLLISTFRTFRNQADEDVINNLKIWRDDVGKPYISYDSV
jgi:AbiV family abortive infection protein